MVGLTVSRALVALEIAGRSVVLCDRLVMWNLVTLARWALSILLGLCNLRLPLVTWKLLPALCTMLSCLCVVRDSGGRQSSM